LTVAGSIRNHSAGDSAEILNVWPVWQLLANGNSPCWLAFGGMVISTPDCAPAVAAKLQRKAAVVIRLRTDGTLLQKDGGRLQEAPATGPDNGNQLDGARATGAPSREGVAHSIEPK
jgi:hypothetical protein